MIRSQPPAHSPLRPGALLGGILRHRSTSSDLIQTLKQRYRSSKVLLVDSGTSALTLGLSSAIEGHSSPLIALPAFGCYDLATAAVGVGADVVLYDVDPVTLAPDPESLDRALEAGPSAVVVAYLFGIPFDVQRLALRVAEAGAILVEDAAQAYGGTVGDAPCGATAAMGILSFGRGKGVTGGGGGALLINNDRLDVADPLPAGGGWSGWTKAWAQWALSRPSWYWLPSSLPFLRLGDTIYHPPRPVEAMALLHQEVLGRLLPLADQETQARQRHGRRLGDLVGASTTVRPVRVAAGEPGYLRYPVLTSDPRFRSVDARRLGIMPGYPRTLADIDALRPIGRNRDAAFPGARMLVEELVTLPTHSMLTDRDFDRLAAFIA